MRRIALLLALVGLVLGGTRSEARIGDTEGQLVTRFGAVQSRRAERIMESGRVYVLGERVVLKPEGWRITAVLINGHCAKITYAKSGRWTETQYDELLSENADRWAWQEIPGEVPKWQRTWQRSDGLVAKWMYASGFAIEGRAFVDACTRAAQNAQQTPAT